MNKKIRYSELDFVRGALMVLGVFYHTALIYKPDTTWAARSIEGHQFFAYFSNFTSSFRMQAFYIIAGFFFLLIVDKKGVSVALKDRLIRLFVPMLFIGFTLNFLPNIASDYYQFPDSFFDYVRNGEWLRHTWFLGNLIIYCLITALFYQKPIINFIQSKPLFFKASMFIGLLCIPLFVFVVKDQTWRITGYENLFFIAPRYLLAFLPYYILGLLAYVWKDTLFNLLSFKMFSYFIMLYISASLIRQFYLGNFIINSILIEFSVLFLCVAMICLLNELGKKVRDTFSRKIADASYTIYLLHSPLIIVLYYYVFKESDINIFIQYLMICSIVLISTYYFHTRIVEKNLVFGFLVNGKALKRKFNI